MNRKGFARMCGVAVNVEKVLDGCFSDTEEVNNLNIMRGLEGAITLEILDMKAGVALERMKNLRDNNKSKGVWMSDEGPICVEDMGDLHLSRIPRFLIERGRVDSIKGVPRFIIGEIKRRGFKVDSRGHVTM